MTHECSQYKEKLCLLPLDYNIDLINTKDRSRSKINIEVNMNDDAVEKENKSIKRFQKKLLALKVKPQLSLRIENQRAISHQVNNFVVNQIGIFHSEFPSYM